MLTYQKFSTFWVAWFYRAFTANIIYYLFYQWLIYYFKLSCILYSQNFMFVCLHFLPSDTTFLNGVFTYDIKC